MTDAIKTINVHELKNKIEAKDYLYLIDVRELEEWQEVRLANALHIPKDQLSHSIASYVENKEAPIYLYCRGGVRSLYAAQQLMDLGYTDVYSVDGGIVEWTIFGYPIET
jgi:rhodanese-related sulfurtransferase